MNPALPRELTFKDDTKVRRKGDVYEQKWGEGFMKLFHFVWDLANVYLKVDCVGVEMLMLLKCWLKELYGKDQWQMDLLTLLQGPPPEQ